MVVPEQDPAVPTLLRAQVDTDFGVMDFQVTRRTTSQDHVGARFVLLSGVEDEALHPAIGQFAATRDEHRMDSRLMNGERFWLMDIDNSTRLFSIGALYARNLRSQLLSTDLPSEPEQPHADQ